MAKRKSNWLKEHFSDPYVRKAHLQGLRSRSVFKLQEIQERDKLFKPGMTVIDMGAAPGGWSQYVASCVGQKGQVIALDILPIKAIPGVLFMQGDFTEESTLHMLFAHIGQSKVDWIISDLAPNLSGINSVDQARSMFLAECVINFACQINLQGGLLIKVFQGEGFEDFLTQMRQHFAKVTIRKPKASRGRSREVYILGKMMCL